MKVVTTKAEVQCEIINLPSVPTCSTPLCSPVKSVGDRSDDDQKDLDYIPKNLYLPDDLVEEEAEEEEEKPSNFENFRGRKRFLDFTQLNFFEICYKLWSLFILLWDILQ